MEMNALSSRNSHVNRGALLGTRLQLVNDNVFTKETVCHFSIIPKRVHMKLLIMVVFGVLDEKDFLITVKYFREMYSKVI